MRTIAVILALAPFSALAQQEGEQQQAALPAPGGGAPVYDIVAADRETAWRIHRVTGEVTICRVDITGGLDAVRARCSIASMQGGGVAPEQSMAPQEAPQGAPQSPGNPAGGAPR